MIRVRHQVVAEYARKALTDSETGFFTFFFFKFRLAPKFLVWCCKFSIRHLNDLNVAEKYRSLLLIHYLSLWIKNIKLTNITHRIDKLSTSVHEYLFSIWENIFLRNSQWYQNAAFCLLEITHSRTWSWTFVSSWKLHTKFHPAMDSSPSPFCRRLFWSLSDPVEFSVLT